MEKNANWLASRRPVRPAGTALVISSPTIHPIHSGPRLAGSLALTLSSVVEALSHKNSAIGSARRRRNSRQAVICLAWRGSHAAPFRPSTRQLLYAVILGASWTNQRCSGLGDLRVTWPVGWDDVWITTAADLLPSRGFEVASGHLPGPSVGSFIRPLTPLGVLYSNFLF